MKKELNKKQMKYEKELQLLGIIFSQPALAAELFAKIPSELFSTEIQSVLENLKQLECIDQNSILHLLNKHRFTKIQEVLKHSAQCPDERSLKLRINEFYDIHDSIGTEEYFWNSYNLSKDSLLGLDLLMEARDKIEGEIAKYNRFQNDKTYLELLPEIIARIENYSKTNVSVKTNNLPSFNLLTGGLNDGNLVGIAGAYKNGKTTLGLNLLLDFVEQSLPAAIFSLEMSANEVQDKILAYKTGVQYGRLRTPLDLTVDEKRNILNLKNKISSRSEKLFVYDRVYTISDIESKIKELSSRQNLRVAMIDYIGLVKSAYKHKNNESREREISELSSSLKILAKETNTIVIVLTQLNRLGIKDASSANLAESIAIARDCDFLFTIQNPYAAKCDRVKIEGREIKVTENDLVVRLDASRHTKSGKSFIVSLNESGKLSEI